MLFHNAAYQFFRNNRICEVSMLCCDSSYRYLALIEMDLWNRSVQNWLAREDVLINKYPR